MLYYTYENTIQQHNEQTDAITRSLSVCLSMLRGLIMDRLQLIDWLEKYFDKIQPVQKEQLLTAFEILSSQTNLPLEYHRLSLATIMEAAIRLQD